MKSRGKWERPNPQTYIVQMSNLSSEEVYMSPDGEQRPVLTGNSLDICRGESWGVVGREAFEVELLLQIVGCVRPYGSGTCKLVERGMMRKKRKILPHVFFVGDSGMAVPNMSVLEYLMFASRFSAVPAQERQIRLLTAMLDSECYEWCFAPIKMLSSQERAVLSLLAASLSDALLLIFPYFYAETSGPLRSMMAHIAHTLRENRAALLMGVTDPALAQDVCSHGAFLIGGTIREKGTMAEMTHALDRRDYILRAPDNPALAQALREAMPGCDIRVRDEFVDVYHGEAGEIPQPEMLKALLGMGLPVDSVRKCEHSLQNAFSEACNDLQHKLL